MKKFNMQEFLDFCSEDKEFMRSIRYMTFSYKVGFGEDNVYIIKFTDGAISGYEENVPVDTPADCWTVGPVATWEKALLPIPPADFHWFRPMCFYQGMQLSQGDAVVYFPMENRFLVLLREFYNK